MFSRDSGYAVGCGRHTPRRARGRETLLTSSFRTIYQALLDQDIDPH